MKRILLSVTSTVVGLVALLSFKSHGGGPTAQAALPAVSLPGTSSTSTRSPAAQGSSAAPKSTANSTSKSTSKPSSASPSSSTVTRRTYVGSDVQTRYGDVQVKVVVSGSKITDVAFVRLDANDGRSQQINSMAAPILLQETISAQSANIDSVSGASYTSAGYIQSLQSALDQAGIK
jgi:uncharacterized protein with FMN-binding domain